MSSKLFGEDDEAVDEGELDKAKADGENGELQRPSRNLGGLSSLRFSGGDREPEEGGFSVPSSPGSTRRGRWAIAGIPEGQLSSTHTIVGHS